MPNEKGKTLAAIYTRISKDREKKGDANARQREDCMLTCQAHDWEVFDVYEDVSRSGWSGAARPAYDQMIRDYRDGKFDVIVAWKLDRLTRSTTGFADMLRELGDQHLRICTSELSDVDLTNSDNEFMVTVLVAVAQQESSRKSQRMKRANLQRAKRGTIKPGTRSFGYDRRFGVIPEEARVVRAIYDAYVRGHSMGAITRAISQGDEPGLEGFPRSDAPSVIFAREASKSIPTKKMKDDAGKVVEVQKKWELPTTQAILRNPKYAGYVAYTPVQKHADGTKWSSPNSRWANFIVRDETGKPVDAVWEPIVDRDVWWAVQRRRDRNLTRADGTVVEKSGNPRKHLGTGIYRCWKCGQPLIASQDGYRCRVPGHVSRMRAGVDKWVCACVHQRLSMPDLADVIQPKDDPAIADIDRAVAAERVKIAEAKANFKAHPLLADVCEQQIAEAQKRIDDLERRRISLLPEAAPTGVICAPDPALAFDELPVPQKAEVIRFLADVTLHPHKGGVRNTPELLARDVEITWHHEAASA